MIKLLIMKIIGQETAMIPHLSTRPDRFYHCGEGGTQ